MKTTQLAQLASVAMACTVATTVQAQDPATTAAGAKVAGSVAQGIALSELFNRIQLLIENAVRDGNYLLARAGIEARTALEAFKDAAGKTLDQTEKTLDRASRDNFSRLSKTIEDLNQKAITSIEATRKISESAVQISSLIDLQGNRTFLLRHEPLVTMPGRKDPLLIKIRGVSLGDAKPSLSIGILDIKPKSIGQQEVLFEVPRELFRHNEDRLALLTVEVSYETVVAGTLNRLVGKRQIVTKPISIVLLPWTAAYYKLSYSTEEMQRSTKRETKSLEQFRGRNEDRVTAVAPPADWRIDLATISHSQGTGEGNSYCVGVSDENKSEFGFTFKAHVGEIKSGKYPLGAPGYVSCTVSYNLINDTPKNMAQFPVRGRLEWTSPKLIPLPPNVRAFVLEAEMFDGTKDIFLNDGQRRFISVEKTPTHALIRPVVPVDVPQ